MNLVLLLIFLCLVLGLFAPRFGKREQLIVGILATAMTALYFFFSYRFM